MEQIKSKLKEIVMSDLSAAEKLPKGSDERYKIENDAMTMLSHIEKISELELRQCDTALKKKSIEAEEQLKQQELAFKKSNAAAEELLKTKELEANTQKAKDQVKSDKIKMGLDTGVRILGFAAGAALPIVAIVADHNGWFPSKTGLNMCSKPRFF